MTIRINVNPRMVNRFLRAVDVERVDCDGMAATPVFIGPSGPYGGREKRGSRLSASTSPPITYMTETARHVIQRLNQGVAGRKK